MFVQKKRQVVIVLAMFKGEITCRNAIFSCKAPQELAQNSVRDEVDSKLNHKTRLASRAANHSSGLQTLRRNPIHRFVNVSVD